MSNNLTTEAGQTKPSTKFTNEQVDTINQVFSLLRLNYHNQYYKAFSNTSDLNAIRRLWLESLTRFDSSEILQAVKQITENEEFLPTLATIIKHCEKIRQVDLPESHSAYLEACRAPSPKANAKWSHLAVYYAGKNSDWYFLQNNPESIAFPVFKAHYQEICANLKNGQTLHPPSAKSLPSDISSPKTDRETNKRRMEVLRKALDI